MEQTQSKLPAQSIKINKKRFPERRGRKIVVDGVKWKYTVGIESVVAYSENGGRKCEMAWKIKGLSHPDDFQRGKRKKSSDGSVFPCEIERWLCQNG